MESSQELCIRFAYSFISPQSHIKNEWDGADITFMPVLCYTSRPPQFNIQLPLLWNFSFNGAALVETGIPIHSLRLIFRRLSQRMRLHPMADVKWQEDSEITVPVARPFSSIKINFNLPSSPRFHVAIEQNRHWSQMPTTNQGRQSSQSSQSRQSSQSSQSKLNKQSGLVANLKQPGRKRDFLCLTNFVLFDGVDIGPEHSMWSLPAHHHVLDVLLAPIQVCWCTQTG